MTIFVLERKLEVYGYYDKDDDDNERKAAARTITTTQGTTQNRSIIDYVRARL